MTLTFCQLLPNAEARQRQPGPEPKEWQPAHDSHDFEKQFLLVNRESSSFPFRFFFSVAFRFPSLFFPRVFSVPSPFLPLSFLFPSPFAFPFFFLFFSLPFPCFILLAFSFSSHYISSPPCFYPSKKRMPRWRASRNRHFDEVRKQDPESDETTGAKKVETSRLVERDVSTFLARVLLQFFQSSSCLKRETSGAKTVETSRLTRRDVSTFLARVLFNSFSRALPV